MDGFSAIPAIVAATCMAIATALKRCRRPFSVHLETTSRKNGVEELLTATEVELAIRKMSKEIQPGMDIEFLAQLAHQLRIGKTLSVSPRSSEFLKR